VAPILVGSVRLVIRAISGPRCVIAVVFSRPIPYCYYDVCVVSQLCPSTFGSLYRLLTYRLGSSSCDMWTLVSLFCIACSLQDGVTPLMFAAQNGHANAVKALLNSGADRCTEVRMIPCPLMTAHQIMLFNGVLLYLAISVVVFCALVVIVM